MTTEHIEYYFITQIMASHCTCIMVTCTCIMITCTCIMITCTCINGYMYMFTGIVAPFGVS